MGSSPTAWILFCFVLLSGIDKYLAGDNVVSAYPRRDKKNTEVPRRTGDEWCLTSAFNKSVHSIILGSDWGAVPTSDRKTWKSFGCDSLVLPSLMREQMQNTNNRDATIQQLQKLGFYDRAVVKRRYNDREYYWFGNVGEKDVDYEFKYPWELYICPGTISLDIGTAYGDTLVLMGAANREGLTFGFELKSGRYMSTEWSARLNPDINIIPYNFGVKANGEPEWKIIEEQYSRVVPIAKWVQKRLHFNRKGTNYLNHVSFIKIDIDGADVDIVRSFAPLIKGMDSNYSSVSSTFFRPIFLIEWFGNFRSKSVDNKKCTTESSAAWTVARDINYKVFDWRFQNEFKTCDAALQFYDSYEGPKSKSKKHCGSGSNEFDLCDLLLVHADSISQEGSKLKTSCPSILEKSIVSSLLQKWSN